MKNSLEENLGSANVSGLHRRAFFGMAAGAAAFWILRRVAFFSPVSAAPATVTIVEFAANGAKTGKKIVPRIVKTDAEWQRQLA